MNQRQQLRMIVLATGAAILAGVGVEAAGRLGQDVSQTSRMQISSSAFAPNGSIPSKYTCDGEGVNPPLTFASIPGKTRSLVLIVDDPDVPKDLVPSGVFDHWLIWDLPADTKGFAEGAGKGGVNGMGLQGYMGPCPPDREHRYFFKLYALDTTLTGARIANKQDLETAMKGHIVGRGELIGRYKRTGQ
jgi:Raf kinase inhibitor-like YbhB/YbcL family protein